MSYIPWPRGAQPARRVVLAGLLTATSLLPGLPQVPAASAQVPPAVNISISDALVLEGNDARFTVTVTNNPGIFVDYGTLPGTALDGVDFVGRTGRVFVPSGSSSATFTVPTIQDNLYEVDKTFSAQLSSPTTGIIVRGTGTATIHSDEPEPVLTVNDISVTEGDTASSTPSSTSP